MMIRHDDAFAARCQHAPMLFRAAVSRRYAATCRYGAMRHADEPP